MRAGVLHQVWIAIDRRVIMTEAGTPTYNCLWSENRNKLDVLLTSEQWVKRGGYFFAPVDNAADWDYKGAAWKGRYALRPALDLNNNQKPIYPGFYACHPEDVRRDCLLFTPNRKRAQNLASQILGIRIKD